MDEAYPTTVSSWFSRGWRVFRERPMPIIGGTVIYTALGLGIVWVGSRVILPGGSVWISNLYNMTVGPVMMVGYWYLCLKLLRGQQASSRDVFSAFPRFRAAWVTNLLFTLITIGGFVLLVVPGIVWSLKYGLSFFAVMDRRLSARQAIRLSGQLTKGYKGRLCLFYLLVFLLALPAGLFSLGLTGVQVGPLSSGSLTTIGLLSLLLWVGVIGPWVGLAAAAAYDSLASREGVGALPAPGVRMWIPAYVGAGVLLLVPAVMLVAALKGYPIAGFSRPIRYAVQEIRIVPLGDVLRRDTRLLQEIVQEELESGLRGTRQGQSRHSQQRSECGSLHRRSNHGCSFKQYIQNRCYSSVVRRYLLGELSSLLPGTYA